MLSLSPEKLLVLLVVALIVLGPDKLPQVARKLGAAWGDLRRLRAKLETDLRSAFPDLPPTHEVAQAVRSPLAFLDRLADEHDRTRPALDPEASLAAGSSSDAPGPEAGNDDGVAHGGAPGAVAATGADNAAPGRPFPSVPDDPSMN